MVKLTTASGIPVADNQNALTAGPRGPILLQDFHLIEKLRHFNGERIPERVVHAKALAPTAPSPSRTTSRATPKPNCLLFSDSGTPDGYRHMGSAAEAVRLAGTEPDYTQPDLYNAIAREDFPRWQVYIQVMTESERLKWEKKTGCRAQPQPG